MTSYFAPLHAENAEPLALDMQSLFLSGRILPFGANLTVTHVFRSSEKSPVEVVYCFPLPRDASLVGFQISGEGFSISSRLENTVDAHKHYEQALEQGSLAALTQQNQDGLVNLTVGNLRPGETVAVHLDLVAGVSLSDSGFRLRFPFTVAPCYHPQMRASLDAPGVGTIELPDEVAGGVFLPPFHRDTSDLHKIGFALRVEPADGIGEIASPSHAVRVLLNNRGAIGVKLSPERDVPNRDLVLDVKCDLGAGRAWSDRSSDRRKHFAAVVPSKAFGQPARTARRIVFLLDRSGSMDGSPIKQARHAIENCLANLSPEDEFGLAAFDEDVERFRPVMLPATRENVEGACAFLHTIDARGGTKLAGGVEAAAQLLGRTSGEIFIVTDGQVFETSEIVRRARKCEARLFCLGIGSASQDRFLALLARQTGGICRFVTASERVDAAAWELFAAVGGAVAAGVTTANANVHPAATATVFPGTPFVTFGEIDREAGSIDVEWPQGARRVPIEALGEQSDGFVEKLEGAKLIADFEAGYDRSDATARKRLLELSQQYNLASSEMSLVAVVERAGDRAGDVPKTKIVPVGMAQDTRFGSYFKQKKPVASMLRIAAYSIADRDVQGLVLASKRRARFALSKAIAMEPLLCEAIRIVEQYVFHGQSEQASSYVSTLLRILSSVQNQLTNKAHKRVLKALIDFLASGRDPVKWTGLCRQLEAAWPQMAAVALPAAVPDSAETCGIKAGMRRAEALRTFEKSVNQPGTMFSTDHWLQPKLEQLRTLLGDPITEEQAIALVDVLHERHWMRDLIGWLQGPPMPWQSFFVLTDYMKPPPAHDALPFDLFKDSGMVGKKNEV